VSDVLRFLLDEHVSLEVAVQIQKKRPDIPILPLQDREEGVYRGVDESPWLHGTFQQSLTLVTFDRRSIEPLLYSMAEQSISHGGIVFVDDRTIRQSDIGGLIRALIALWDRACAGQWANRVIFLQPAPKL